MLSCELCKMENFLILLFFKYNLNILPVIKSCISEDQITATILISDAFFVCNRTITSVFMKLINFKASYVHI